VFAADPATHRLWATDGFCRPSSILQLDSAGGTLTGAINPGGVAAGLAYGDGALWASVADNGRGKSGFLAEVDPTTGSILGKLSTGGTGDVAFGDGAVYVESQATGRILRVTH
jgi:DNA-binding beta-propeller fold protein YncE